MSIQNYSLRYINATIKLLGFDFEWNVEPARRQRLWEALMVCHICNALLIYIFFFFFFFYLLLIYQILNCAHGVLHPPRFNTEEIKKEDFKDLSQKLRSWRAKLKKKLNVQPGETPEEVQASVGDQAFMEYDPKDMRVLLDRWCDERFQVGYSQVILLFCVLSLISCDCAYHITNILGMLIV